MKPGKLYKTTELIIGRTHDSFKDILNKAILSDGRYIMTESLFMYVGPFIDAGSNEVSIILVGDEILYTYGGSGSKSWYERVLK